jgi:hypothetical protein
MKKKKGKVGGYRQRLTPKYAQQALLTAIINYYGGPTEVAKMLGLHPAVIINYRLRGKFVIAQVVNAVKVLKVSPFALSYPDWKVTGNQLPSWEDVVKSVKFLPKDLMDMIIAMPLMRVKGA